MAREGRERIRQNLAGLLCPLCVDSVWIALVHWHKGSIHFVSFQDIIAAPSCCPVMAVSCSS